MTMDEIRDLIRQYGAAEALCGGATTSPSAEPYRAALLQAVEALELEAAKADSWRQAADGYKRERDEARGCTAAVAEGADEWKSRALAAESSLESMRQERDEAQDRAVSAQVHAEQLSDLLYRRVEEMRLRAEGAEADLMRRTQEYTADIQTAVRMNDAAERALREAREVLKAPDADRCDCDGQKGQGCTICASSETPAAEGGAQVEHLRAGIIALANRWTMPDHHGRGTYFSCASELLAEWDRLCLESPGTRAALPVSRLAGTFYARCPLCHLPASPASAPSRGTDHDPATKEQS